jgi:Zn-dependent protease with chaperone function
VGISELKGRCGVYPKVRDIPRVGNPTSICQIMTIEDSCGYKIRPASRGGVRQASHTKSQQLSGIAAAHHILRSTRRPSGELFALQLHTVTASTLLRCRLAGALLAIVIAMPSRLAASDTTPPVNRYLLLQDVELGAEAAEELRRQVPLLTDEAVSRYISELGHRLVDALPDELPRSGFQFSFEILNRSDVATLALPGGSIFITRGMIDAAASEAELAGLLAHELSHVVLRHATAQISSGKSYMTGRISGLALASMVDGGRAGILARAASFGVSSYFLTYDNQYERQADLVAVRTLKRAGYDPAWLTTMLQRLTTEPAASDPIHAIHARLLEIPAARIDASNVRRSPLATPVHAVSSPSGEYRATTVGEGLVLNVPRNWQSVRAGTTVTFAPEDAFHTDVGVVAATHGVQLTLARSLGGDLAFDVQALLQRLGEANAGVRWTPAFQRLQIGGRKGLRTTLNAVSPTTGRFEEVSVAAIHLHDSNVLYIVGIAPQEDSGVYRGVFNRIVESIQIAR